MKSLAAIEEEVNNLADDLDEPVDEKIKRIVVALRYSGFNTTGSCEGHLDHGFPYPWVEIRYDDKKFSRSERKRLKKLLKTFHETRNSKCHLLIQDFADFRLQSVKWPRSARKRRKYVDIPDEKVLAVYQSEMNDFAEFIVSLRNEGIN